MINRLKEKSWQEIIYMYAYTRFNAYRRRKEISGIGLQARRSLAGNLYNDFHLLLFGGSWDRDRGLSRLSPWTGSCAPPPRVPRVLPLHSTFATGIARGYPEVSQNRNRSRQGGGASGGRLRLAPPRSRPRSPSRFLYLGGGIAPPFALSVSVALARAVSRVRRTPRIARDDLMPRRPTPPIRWLSLLSRCFQTCGTSLRYDLSEGFGWGSRFVRKVIRRKGYFGGRDGSSKRQVSVVYRTSSLPFVTAYTQTDTLESPIRAALNLYGAVEWRSKIGRRKSTSWRFWWRRFDSRHVTRTLALKDRSFLELRVPKVQKFSGTGQSSGALRYT